MTNIAANPRRAAREVATVRQFVKEQPKGARGKILKREIALPEHLRATAVDR